MTQANLTAKATNGGATPLKLDAAVIGAGVAGLYQLHLLRKQGLTVRAFDAASDVGGTWYWNRYPGARLDSQAYEYQYLFSEELYKGWSWTERYASQPELERWMHYVADKLDLRRDIQFNTTITSAHFNEGTGRWILTTDGGEVIDAQYVISCCGALSAPMSSLFPGQETFKGLICHTARWPKEPVDWTGKRVGVVGIAATGIQVVQALAEKVDQLTAFVRTPQYVLPMKNPTYTAVDQEEYKSKFDWLTKRLPNTFGGFVFDFELRWADLTPEQRLAALEEAWNDGSLKLWIGGFAECLFVPEINHEVSEFVRAKMRARLHNDPHLCDVLIPSDYGFGTHRVPMENGFLDLFLRPNVKAVGVKNNPIECITPDGLRLKDGTEYKFDVIILATGFDAGSGALTRIDIRGRGGRSLKEDWGRDIRTTMGMQVHGYPNLFMTSAPLAPAAALCNGPTCLQQQVEWIADCIRYLGDRNLTVCEPTREAEDQWVEHHDQLANATLFTKTDSWYMGSNVPGKPRRMMSYVGGLPQYGHRCAEVAANDYAGFALS